MKTIFAAVGALFSRLPFCSLTGAVVGSFTGFLMGLFALENPAMPLSPQQLFIMGLLVGVAGFLLVLYFLGTLLRYGVGAIFWPALANALATAILTVFVTHWLNNTIISGVIGLLIGILIGAALCRLCCVAKRSGDAQT